MRWTEYLESLPPAEQERLVNYLNLGFGRMSYAARLMHDTTELPTIVGELTAAHDLLVASRRILSPRARPTRDSAQLVPAAVPVAWDRAFAVHPLGEERRVLGAMAGLVRRARQLGEATMADADLTIIRRHVRLTERTLDRLRTRLVDLATSGSLGK